VLHRLLFLTAPVIILVVGLAPTSDRPAEAAFPGANGKIVFASNRTGDYEIFVMNANREWADRLDQ
jgi:hypothetical protein